MKCSKAFCLQRAAISSLPFGIDDPSFPVDLNEVVVSFYNGTISAIVMCGSLLPLICPIYSSNFTFGKNERYVHRLLHMCIQLMYVHTYYYFIYMYTCRISSRALLIPFKNPKFGPSNVDQAAAFQQLPDRLEAASSMAGAVVRIEKDLIDGGRAEILELINPMLFDVVGISNPQVVTGCSILLYFTYKVISLVTKHKTCVYISLHILGEFIQISQDTLSL